ncbi:efflux RND transporter permease subunit [Haliangium ochraceum]|uniref:Acriflavin resistance protein n=1 Tax=Haliangium ochraceum (strain DSM 14365 / JCM 11303 / SMP-2) TaxID=502025 RepID=D0LNZ3_HALO1|nr:efflux RND transporter permease subunit [Haliangium ochraceum]ACY18819.1 acriflavin resistance protein [Haliangium ochraceum DSM 14365]
MGAGIIRWAISRPVSVSVGVILVVLFGALTISGIPIQLTPDVTVPYVTVRTTWPGATPAEVEAEILIEQEDALKSLPGLVRMTSQAQRGTGSIELELEVGASLDEALVRVSNLLSQVPEYPRTARQPVVSTSNTTGSPLAVMIIRSDPPGRAVAEYRTWVEEVILPQLERIRGVASIRLIGGRDTEVHVDFDPTALAARGVTVSQIRSALGAELSDVSAGDIPIGKRRYVVRTQVTPDVPEKLARTVLRTDDNGAVVTLGDVAEVRVGMRKPDAVAFNNGAPSMALLAYQESGSNVLEVTREIYDEVELLQRDFMAPEGLELRVISDQIGYIGGALDLVRNNLLVGAALAIGVLLLFLRSVGASMVVAVSIPLSTVGTVLIMSLLGRAVNIVSLAGMAFAIGMVVDNSIVVLENIDTWRGRVSDMGQAALSGAREVWGAIFASTCTTAAVFLPIVAWQDELGELLRDVALAISTAVFVSLLVSVVVIPSFAARVLRARKREDAEAAGEGEGGEAAKQSASDDAALAAPSEIDSAALPYRRVGSLVHWLVASPARSLLTAVIGVVGTAAIGLSLLPPTEYLPVGNRNIVFGVVVPPPGYSVEEMEQVGTYVQGRILSHLGKEVDGVPAIDRTFFTGSPDSAFMGAVAVDPEQVDAMAGFLRQVLSEIPDIIGFANKGSLFGRSLGGGRSIEIDITGSDLEGMSAFGGRLMGAIYGALPGSQVRPIPGLDLGAPEFRMLPKRSEASRQGLSSADIGLLVDAYVDGAIIGELGREGESKRDVILRASGVEIDSPADLLAAPVGTPAGSVIPAGEIADLVETLGPTVIQRIERRRAITLQVSPPEDVPFETAIARVRDELVPSLSAEGAIPGDIRLVFGGSAGKLDEAKTRFLEVLLLAVIITFLLLAALFEDFLAPVAILVTVPLAGAGGVIGLRIVDALLGPQALDMLTMTGFVILIGVVVNNAILIVDGSLSRMREQALSLEQAVTDAVRGRVRPILMSATTSLAGLLPLVLFPGSGSELYRGVGSIVLGGLAFSTFLSLFLVPAVFTSLWRMRFAVARLRTRRS